MTDNTHIALTAPASVDMALITGPGDNLLRIVQSAFTARIGVRGDMITLEGDPTDVQSLTVLFSDLIKLVEEGGKPDGDYVRHAIDLLRADEYSPRALREDILLTYRGRAVRPKTAGQKRYVDAIRANTITFGVGPAGTGKTYLAMAMAVAALKRKEVGRIILTRPVVEAGENLGFLPGTLEEKIDPYIRPLYDALFDMTDMERARSLIEDGVIEIAPLAFMRGRTLNDSFIILDEAQNTTSEQMKTFDAVVWASHGLFVSGADFDSTFGLLHTIEKAADIYGRARAMNGGSGEFLNTITDEGLRQIGREFNVKINEAMLDFPAASATDN